MNSIASLYPSRSLIYAAVSMTLILMGVSPSQARTFQAEGSDTGLGVGARYVALGGSGVAVSDDVYAAYHNPAGLADLEGFEFSVSRQLDAELRTVNFFGIAARLPLDPGWGYKATIAGAYFPRIHAHSTGAFDEDEFESIFLRYLLPGISGTFDGEIDSKTKVYRLAVGVGPSGSDRWSAGFNIDYIDCKTGSCGVHGTSNGYTVISSGATAYSYGLGFKYRPSPTLTLAGSISDINTTLNVGLVTTDNAGTRSSTFETAFPRKISLGAAYKYGTSMLFTGNYEITKGSYGINDLDLQTLRMGVEIKRSDSLAFRFGLVAPLKIHSDQVADFPLPIPAAPTAGLGWRQDNFRVDLSVYAHPIMTLHKNKASPSADLNLTVNF